VFTGGIGENSPEIRARICDGLQWLGLDLNNEMNQTHHNGKEGLISEASSRLSVYVIPTDEELLIARDTVRSVLGAPQRY
jgi:acetate kinase